MLNPRSCVGAFGACVLLASICWCAEQTGENKQIVAIRASRVIDGKGETALKDGLVLVEGDKISAVGSALPIPAKAKVIDLADATLLPGLIDAHTHLLSEMDGSNLTLQDVEMLRIVATQSTAERALLGAKLGSS